MTWNSLLTLFDDHEGISGMAAVAAALAAIIGVWLTVRDSQLRTRPEMVAWLSYDDVTMHVLVNIKNTGGSTAHKVRIEFSDGVPRGTPIGNNVAALVRQKYDRTVMQWPSGFQDSTFYIHMMDKSATQPDDLATATIRYRRSWLARYKTMSALDMRQFKLDHYMDTKRDPKIALRDISKAMDKLVKRSNGKYD